MPNIARLKGYLEEVTALLLPCEPVNSIWQSNRILVIAKTKPGCTLQCPSCNNARAPRGSAKPRLVRHLDFEDMPVWVEVTFPRIHCPEHGYLVANQSFCEPRCQMSHAFEDAILQLICESDATESELKRKFDLRGQALERMIVRARDHFRNTVIKTRQ